MNNNTPPRHRRRRTTAESYSFVPSEKRHLLIQMVEKDQWVAKEASELLGIKYSTAKSILRLFRSSGRIDIIPKKLAPSTSNDLTVEVGEPFPEASV